MKISYNWLKEYITPLPSPLELADRLTMAGLEVEGIDDLSNGISGVVIAQVLSVDRHPNADRLSLCQVKTNRGVHSIVCGAKNMKAGDIVALALPGAALPKGIKIENTKIRGVASEGMMCSETELGLKDTSAGIMILPPDMAIGADFNQAMGMDDFILNINVTPNRPDCLSILGIAREVGAIIRAELKLTGSKIKSTGSDINKLVSVSIEEPALCRRYAARLIENVKIKPSPDWLKQRLESIGLRPVNNVVDITNYVMIEYGQPLHAFDYDLLAGRTIVVRKAQAGEKILTLDNQERILRDDILAICDREKPVAIAGIMGGKESEITDSTKHILLESAYFDPAGVRKTSRLLGIGTESSYRFERGTDIEGVTRALDRAAMLISEIAGGDIASGVIDHYPSAYKAEIIRVRRRRINKVLGDDIKKEDIEACFTMAGLGFGISDRHGQDAVWDIVRPSYRVDITGEIDIVEEVARLRGYDSIPTAAPSARVSAAEPENIDLVREGIRSMLVNNGFSEAINYSFISSGDFEVTGNDAKKGIRLINPLTEDQSLMRQSLIPGLLNNLRYNLYHNNCDIKLFEIGSAFIQDKNIHEQKELASAVICGHRYSEAWNSGKDNADFYDAKGAVQQILDGLGISGCAFTPAADIPFLHPGKSCRASLNDVSIGVIGEVHPDAMQKLDIKQPAYLFELDMDALLKFYSIKRDYKSIPRFPMIIRDAAMILDRDIPFQQIYDAIKGLNIKLLEEVNIFDVYYGKNVPETKRSMAIRFMYRCNDRTLTEEEVNAAHSEIIKNLKHGFGIEVRGE